MMKLQVRLREQDRLLREYFEKVPDRDKANEARRLMFLSLQAGNGMQYEEIPSNLKKIKEMK